MQVDPRAFSPKNVSTSLVRDLLTYQPANRYRPFQWYELAIFVVLALVLAGSASGRFAVASPAERRRRAPGTVSRACVLRAVAATDRC
jgi:hypothetical protein